MKKIAMFTMGTRGDVQPYIFLFPISKYILERNKYWEDKNVLTGYWYEDDTDYQPDEKMIEFLKSGDKPVILALGAMSLTRWDLPSS